MNNIDQIVRPRAANITQIGQQYKEKLMQGGK
jgi:hypothetical protein